VEISTKFKISTMPVTRHQGDARHCGALVSLDPARYANFETAGCSKCRFSGCRACRGYTLREYQAFLEAQGGNGGEQEGFGGGETVATLTPVVKEGSIRHGRINGGAVGRDGGRDVGRAAVREAQGGEQKVGCSKCRFRGCKKCRGYTLAELRVREATEIGGHDSGKGVVVDRGSLEPGTSVGRGGGRKRGRNASSCDTACLEAGGPEIVNEEEEGIDEDGVDRSCKKKRWAMGAFSGLRDKVMSAVYAPLNALSSFTFWSRSDHDGVGDVGEEEETEERQDGGALLGGSAKVVPGKRPDAEQAELKGMEVEDECERENVGVRRSAGARHARVVKHRRATNTESSVALGTFPHFLARPNRVAPPRARSSNQLRNHVGRKCVGIVEKENVEPEAGGGAERLGTKSAAIPSVTGNMTNRTTRMRDMASMTVTPLTRTRKARTSSGKAGGEDSLPKICAETPETAAKTPTTRQTTNRGSTTAVTATVDDAGDKAFKTRKTRLSAAKVSTKAKGAVKGGAKSSPVHVVKTPAVHDERNAEKANAVVPEHVPDSERLHNEIAPTCRRDGRGDERVAVVDANANNLVDERQTQNFQEEQHSTPTPEVSFSFADMAGASKDTISADQFHQYSQDEQGSHLTSASGLSPLRLPGAAESDFAFAEALQAFSSPEHDRRAVTRAMDVVGNLMLDLDVSPDVKNGRQAKTPGKHGYQPAPSPTVEFVDPNSSSPALSPVTFVLPDASRGSKGPGNKGRVSAPEVRFGTDNRCKGKAALDHPISSLAADQGSLESAKHLLKKNMVLKQASQDALYMKVREVIINRHLVEVHRQGHDWATLDACGVPLDASADHAGIEAKVLKSVRKEYGDDTLHRLVTQVEEEWKRMCSVRQKYSKNAAVASLATEGFQPPGCSGNNGTKTSGKTTPTRSILRQQRSSQRLKQAQTLRWAPDNVEHTYTPKTAQDMEDREKESSRLPSSTRGLRMLGLASASPKGGPSANGSGGKVSSSPMPPSPTGLAGTTNTMTTATPGGSGGSGGNIGNGSGPSRRRSRTQNVQNTGTRSSQGQRLFQALQNASCPDSQQPSSTPRTLAMIFDSLPDNGNDHSNNTSSAGPTNSDTTTSSNSSRGSGGGGRWEQAEVECLIRGFKEWACMNRSQYVWKFIGDTYRGCGLADCRTNDDLKSKWKAMRKTVGRNRPLRYVKLTEDDLEFLRSEDSKP